MAIAPDPQGHKLAVWLIMLVRVQRNFVSEKRNRWIVTVVVLLGVVALVGAFLFPLLAGVLEANQPVSPPTPTPSAEASLANESKLEAQEQSYETFLQDEPNNETALRRLLEIRLELVRQQKREVKDVIEPLEKLVKLNPTQTDYGVLLAQAKQYSGDREGAANAYNGILASDPGNLNALQGLVQLQLKEERPEAAIGLLQETLKNAPQANQAKPQSIDVVSVQLMLGDVYAQQKRYEEAIAIYDETIKAAEKDFRPIVGKAIVLQMQGKDDEAKPLFTTAAELAPAQYKDQIKQLANQATPPTAAPSPAGEAEVTPEVETTPAEN